MTFNEIKTRVSKDPKFKENLIKNKKKGWRMYSGYLVSPDKTKK